MDVQVDVRMDVRICRPRRVINFSAAYVFCFSHALCYVCYAMITYNNIIILDSKVQTIVINKKF